MYKTLTDIQRILGRKKPDTVLNKFVQSYLEGLHYTPLTVIQGEYEALLARRGYPDVEPQEHPQIWDEEIQAEIDDPDWTPTPTQEEIDQARIDELEAAHSWLKELAVSEDDQAEYDSLLQKLADFVPERDENGDIIEGQSALTTEEEARKTTIEGTYPWLPGDWTRTPPEPTIDIDGWRRQNYVMLRKPYLEAMDQDSLNEALYDARQGDSTKLDAHDAQIQAIKTRFPKPD